MRGTLHLLPTAELGTWLAAFGTYTHYGNRSDEMDVLADAVGAALHGRLLTREELASEVRTRTGSPMLEEWVRESWGTSLKAISFRGLLCFASSENGRVRFTTPATGLLCFASSENGRVRFTTPATWVPNTAKRPDAATALQEVTRRFLAAYGPTTPKHFGLWWGGTAPTRARKMLEALGDDVREVELDGERVWLLANDAPELESVATPRAARLLPEFDPWVVGAARTDDAVVDPAHRGRVYWAQGWLSPVVLVDGRIVGVWRHSLKTRHVAVELEPFARLPAWAAKQLEAEAERLAAFFERELRLSLVG
jgi:hypothetical protein